MRGQVEPLHRLKYLMVTRRETATTENLLEGGCLGIKSRSEYRSSRSAKARTSVSLFMRIQVDGPH